MNIPKEFIKYCLVGVVNTLVGITTAYVVLNPLQQSYFLATISSYVVGIIVSFTLNRHFTFHFEKGNTFILFLKFSLSMLPCYVVSYYILGVLLAKFILNFHSLRFLAEQFFMLFGVEQTKVADNFAIIVSMGVYLILGYSLNKYFIFKKNKNYSPE